MPKDDLRYAGHMVDCARQIQAYLTGKDRAAFDADEILRLAVIHLVPTMGEAARLVSGDFQCRHPEVPWPAIVGMRHRIKHDYLNIDYDIAWEVAIHDLQTLIGAPGPLLPPIA
ncbi:MAG: DUF86 domain-containing protein [Deltaproteobacteria bacterium]